MAINATNDAVIAAAPVLTAARDVVSVAIGVDDTCVVFANSSGEGGSLPAAAVRLQGWRPALQGCRGGGERALSAGAAGWLQPKPAVCCGRRSTGPRLPVNRCRPRPSRPYPCSPAACFTTPTCTLSSPAACLAGAWPPALVPVPGDTRWKAVAVGRDHKCGLTTGSQGGRGGASRPRRWRPAAAWCAARLGRPGRGQAPLPAAADAPPSLRPHPYRSPVLGRGEPGRRSGQRPGRRLARRACTSACLGPAASAPSACLPRHPPAAFLPNTPIRRTCTGSAGPAPSTWCRWPPPPPSLPTPAPRLTRWAAGLRRRACSGTRGGPHMHCLAAGRSKRRPRAGSAAGCGGHAALRWLAPPAPLHAWRRRRRCVPGSRNADGSTRAPL